MAQASQPRKEVRTIAVGGTAWDDDPIYDGVREVNLKYGATTADGAIGYFQAVYDKNGEAFQGPGHGKPPLTFKSVKIKLEFPDEYIVSVSGFRGTLPQRSDTVVRSLKFETNRRTFGPYGVEDGTSFNFPVEDGHRVAGFKGESGEFLNAIGIHLA